MLMCVPAVACKSALAVWWLHLCSDSLSGTSSLDPFQRRELKMACYQMPRIFHPDLDRKSLKSVDCTEHFMPPALNKTQKVHERGGIPRKDKSTNMLREGISIQKEIPSFNALLRVKALISVPL